MVATIAMAPLAKGEQTNGVWGRRPQRVEGRALAFRPLLAERHIEVSNKVGSILQPDRQAHHVGSGTGGGALFVS